LVNATTVDESRFRPGQKLEQLPGDVISPFQANGNWVSDKTGKGVAECARRLPPQFVAHALNQVYGATMEEGKHTNTISAMNQMRYIPKIGDKIHAGVGSAGGAGYTGVVTKVDEFYAYFKNDEGRTFRAPFKVVTRAYSEGKDTCQFQDGDRVRLVPPYVGNDAGVFTVSQCDPDRKRCWVGDRQNRGWYVTFDQIKKVGGRRE
jgi:hypothetical protein